MVRRFVWILLSLLITAGSAFANGGNLLQNSDFSVMTNGSPQAWLVQSWLPNASYSHHKNEAGVPDGVILKLPETNDVRIMQKVAVEPGAYYRFSASIQTRDVPDGVGATLCVMGGFIRSESVTGNSPWKKVELNMQIGEGVKEIYLAARLGFFGEVSKGAASFKDFSFVKLDGPVAGAQKVSPPSEKPKAAQTPAPSAPKKFPVFPLLAVIAMACWFLGSAFRDRFAQKPWARKFQTLPEWKIILPIAIGAFLIRIPFFLQIPFRTDTSCFFAWAARMAANGPFGFYAPGYFCDYPPFSLLTLWPIGGLLNLFARDGVSGAASLILKLPGFAADFGTALLLFRIFSGKAPTFFAKKAKAPRPVTDSFTAALLALGYLILPPVVYNSAYWGQVDTYYTFLMVLAFRFLITDRMVPASVAVAASLFTKTQTIAFAPALFIFWLFRKDWKTRFQMIGAGLATLAVIYLPFVIGSKPEMLFSFLGSQASGYQYGAFNAGNFISFIGGNAVLEAKPLLGTLDFINYRLIAIVCYLLSLIPAVWIMLKKKDKAGLAAAFYLLAFGFFLFFPRMHERYLFPAIAFLLITAVFWRDRLLVFLAGILSVSYMMNLHIAVLKYGPTPLGDYEFNRALLVIGIVNLWVYALSILRLIYRLSPKIHPFRKFWTRAGAALPHALEIPAQKPYALELKDLGIIGGILVLSVFLFYFRLGTIHTPKTGLPMQFADQSVELVYNRPVVISKVRWYDGEGVGNLRLDALEGTNYRFLANLECSDFYKERETDLPMFTTRIRLSPNPSAGKVLEFAALDSAGHVIVPMQVIDSGLETLPLRHPLTDEPDTLRKRPTYRNSTYFDEIYHGRTAFEFVNHLPVYETTHPPLGKWWLSLGIRAFGMNPIGMRVMHALSGVLFILILFFLGREIFRTREGALLLSSIGLLDFMPFVQSRYSTVDTTSVMLIALMGLFALRYFRMERENPKSIPLNLTGIFFFFGLSVGVKWTAVYGLAGAGAVVLLRLALDLREVSEGKITFGDFFGRRFLPTALFTVLGFALAALLYYLSYIPFNACKGIDRIFSMEYLRSVLASQHDMYDYHSKLTASHPYASSFWAWPLNLKPLWMYAGPSEAPGMKASIVSMGNPILWFVMMAGWFAAFYNWLKKPRVNFFLLLTLLPLSLYLPWVMVSRVTFIYHFYPLLAFMYAFVAIVWFTLRKSGEAGKKTARNLAILAGVLWLLYYPVLSGLSVPELYNNLLKFLPQEWWF